MNSNRFALLGDTLAVYGMHHLLGTVYVKTNTQLYPIHRIIHIYFLLQYRKMQNAEFFQLVERYKIKKFKFYLKHNAY